MTTMEAGTQVAPAGKEAPAGATPARTAIRVCSRCDRQYRAGRKSTVCSWCKRLAKQVYVATRTRAA